MNDISCWKKNGSLLFIGLLICVSVIPSMADVADSSNMVQSPIQYVNDPKGNDWWSMFHHDAAHSGVSTTTAPDDNSILWSYQTKYWFMGLERLLF
jgi:hypothetical protein